MQELPHLRTGADESLPVIRCSIPRLNNRDFLRLIIMEGLGGDDAALEQYDRLIGLWERALTTVLRRYEDKGEVSRDLADPLARQIIYTILMTFEESLLGRHVSPAASTTERRDELTRFVSAALERIVQGINHKS